MRFSDVAVPDIYTDSWDFRFFLKWFETCLEKIKYDTENLFDCYDFQRCPSSLLWMLADTIGYKFDDRFCVAYNRLVMMYFMSMIRNKGCRNGIILAAETNLAQFNIQAYGEEDPKYYYRLEDTSVPVNSVYVSADNEAGYIDITYFSTEIPKDACIEYVRPLGMYCFEHAGVKVDARTKISVDARLTNTNELEVSIGPTHVGHYSRRDYASLQRVSDEFKQFSPNGYKRKGPTWYRNSDVEPDRTRKDILPGYRALYSLQLCNNDHIVKSMLKPVFSIGYGPQDVGVTYPEDYLKRKDDPQMNLRYDRAMDESYTPDVRQIEDGSTIIKPVPAVNPPMIELGCAIPLNDENTSYTTVENHRPKKV